MLPMVLYPGSATGTASTRDPWRDASCLLTRWASTGCSAWGWDGGSITMEVPQNGQNGWFIGENHGKSWKIMENPKIYKLA